MKKVDNLNGKSIEDLHNLFTVDCTYGKLYWKERTPEQFIGSPNPTLQCQHWNSRFANKQAGGIGNFKGKLYRRVNIGGKLCQVGRVFLFITKGYNMPECVVDHINGNSLDDSPNNLRYLTKGDNTRHRLNSNNKHGYIGVYEDKGGYRGKVLVDGKFIRTPKMLTPLLAYEEYLKLKKIHHTITEVG